MKVAVNPQTGDRVYLDEQSNTWKPYTEEVAAQRNLSPAESIRMGSPHGQLSPQQGPGDFEKGLASFGYRYALPLAVMLALKGKGYSPGMAAGPVRDMALTGLGTEAGATAMGEFGARQFVENPPRRGDTAMQAAGRGAQNISAGVREGMLDYGLGRYMDPSGAASSILKGVGRFLGVPKEMRPAVRTAMDTLTKMDSSLSLLQMYEKGQGVPFIPNVVEGAARAAFGGSRIFGRLDEFNEDLVKRELLGYLNDTAERNADEWGEMVMQTLYGGLTGRMDRRTGGEMGWVYATRDILWDNVREFMKPLDNLRVNLDFFRPLWNTRKSTFGLEDVFKSVQHKISRSGIYNVQDQAGQLVVPSAKYQAILKEIEDTKAALQSPSTSPQQKQAFYKKLNELYAAAKKERANPSELSVDSPNRLGKYEKERMDLLPDLSISEAIELKQHLNKSMRESTNEAYTKQAAKVVKELDRRIDETIKGSGDRKLQRVWTAANKFHKESAERMQNDVMNTMEKTLRAYPGKIVTFFKDPKTAMQRLDALEEAFVGSPKEITFYDQFGNRKRRKITRLGREKFEELVIEPMKYHYIRQAVEKDATGGPFDGMLNGKKLVDLFKESNQSFQLAERIFGKDQAKEIQNLAITLETLTGGGAIGDTVWIKLMQGGQAMKLAQAAMTGAAWSSLGTEGLVAGSFAIFLTPVMLAKIMSNKDMLRVMSTGLQSGRGTKPWFRMADMLTRMWTNQYKEQKDMLTNLPASAVDFYMGNANVKAND